MSINRREEILERLFDINTSLIRDDGLITSIRNRGLLDNDRLPAIVLLDGDESTTSVPSGRGRIRMHTVLVAMKPQIFVLLKTRKPQNVDTGQHLNGFRGEILRAIAADEQLLALIGPNGDITYDGCETDLKTGGAMEGEMRLDFTIRTVINPNT